MNTGKYFVALMVVSVCACAPSTALQQATPEPPSARAALGEGTCPTSGLSEPLLVDMKDKDRAQVELALGRSVAVFRYDCDGLRLLAGCSVFDGDYGYAGFTRKERVLRLRNADELHANLPAMGLAWAATLSADFEHGTSLDVALVTVGQRATTVSQVSRDGLRGECEGATHFAKYAHLGAFALETSKSATARTAAQVFGAGAAAKASSSKLDRIVDGNLASCDKATLADRTPPEGCGAVLRLGLVPIGERPAAPAGADGEHTCPKGMIFSDAICTTDTLMARCRTYDLTACQKLCDRSDVDGCYLRASQDVDNPERLTKLRKLCDEQHHAAACEGAATALLALDRASSLPYWKKACELAIGTYGAECENFGYLSLQVKGAQATPDDRREALAALRRACAAGSAQGCLEAGKLLIEPDLTKRVGEPDEGEALALFLRACFASKGACATAGQLVEGRSWCDITSADPKHCKGPAPTAKTIAKDRVRALVLYRNACTADAESCHHLFRFGEFSTARIDGARASNWTRECTQSAKNDHEHTRVAYSCVLAARMDQGGPDAPAHLKRACEDSAWLATRESSACRDLSNANNVWECQTVRVAQEAARWACDQTK